MHGRQRVPQQWLIVASPGQQAIAAARRLPRGAGILLLQRPPATQIRRLMHIARERGLWLVMEEPRTAARVHNIAELRRALLARVPIVLLSPIYPTRSHPEWEPIRRMRAATLARLGGRRLLALGGMNPKRYAAVAPLGFIGWAGIGAFRT